VLSVPHRNDPVAAADCEPAAGPHLARPQPEGTVHISDTPVPRDHDGSAAGADSRWFPTLDSRTFEVDGVSIFARYFTT
jgi:hypothetical protein